MNEDIKNLNIGKEEIVIPKENSITRRKEGVSLEENGEIKLRYAFTPPGKKKVGDQAANQNSEKGNQISEANPEISTRTQFGRLDRLVEEFKK